MKRNLVALAGMAVMVAVLQVSGCVSLIPPQTIPFNLPVASRSFDVEAGVPAKNTLTITDFDTSGFAIVAGSMTIDPAAITVTPDSSATGKGRVNLQARTLTVVVILGAPETEESVCDDGEQYGPFAIELDEDFVATSITPPTIAFTDNAVSLLNGGSFVLCIEVEADFDGHVQIDRLVFTVSVG